MRRWSGHVSVSRQWHRQEHAAHRQRSALFVAGVATRLAQGIAALTQLWLAPSQLPAPPAAGAAAHGVHGAQARRDGARPGGHAGIHAATIERTPQAAVPLLRRGDGDRASAYLAPGTLGLQRWRCVVARCNTRGTQELNRQREHLHWPPTCPRVWWRRSFRISRFASNHPCNEGGGGNKGRQRQTT